MAYSASGNLPFEAASKLGHLSVIEDPFVKDLLHSFEKVQADPTAQPPGAVESVDLEDVKPLEFVIAVDGSLSTIPNTLAPHKTLSYIKIAALNISLEELEKAQAPIVNPDTVHQLLSTHADTESTVVAVKKSRTTESGTEGCRSLSGGSIFDVSLPA